LEEIHRERVQAMKEAQERRMKMEREGHGTLSEVEEKEFLPEVTTTQLVVAHFYHQEFERCRIMDKHLSALSKKYFDTKFIKISATDAPFFVTKLQVKVLPCLIFFKNGVAFDRLVGFEDLGGKDDYPTAKLERILLDAGAVVSVERNDSDSEDEAEEIRREAMNRMIRGGYHRNDDDEDSDFE
jgi:thiol-disulfide isomerase/thioredoxin